MKTWTPIFALPNLFLDAPIEGPGIAILPLEDPRICKAFNAMPSLRTFFSSFTTPTGGQISPPALVSRTSQPGLEELLAFRNAAAICLLTSGWAAQVAANSATGVPLYSNALDVYPAMVTTDGKGLIWSSSTMSGWDDISSFRGQCSPQFPHPSHIRGRIDSFLFDGLMRVWARRFQRKRAERWSTRVFRALQMAYRATETPSANKGMAVDWGTGASLWVSAFEVLTHPGPNARVGFPDVADALEEAPWLDPRIARHGRHLCKHGNRKWTSMAASAYQRVYDLRNRVLHGEAMPRGRVDHYLPLAVLLFRGLLVGELTRRGVVTLPGDDVTAHVRHHRFEKSLLEAFSRVPRPRRR